MKALSFQTWKEKQTRRILQNVDDLDKDEYLHYDAKQEGKKDKRKNQIEFLNCLQDVLETKQRSLKALLFPESRMNEHLQQKYIVVGRNEIQEIPDRLEVESYKKMGLLDQNLLQKNLKNFHLERGYQDSPRAFRNLQQKAQSLHQINAFSGANENASALTKNTLNPSDQYTLKNTFSYLSTKILGEKDKIQSISSSEFFNNKFANKQEEQIDNIENSEINTNRVQDYRMQIMSTIQEVATPRWEQKLNNLEFNSMVADQQIIKVSTPHSPRVTLNPYLEINPENPKAFQEEYQIQKKKNQLASKRLKLEKKTIKFVDKLIEEVKNVKIRSNLNKQQLDYYKYIRGHNKTHVGQSITSTLLTKAKLNPNQDQQLHDIVSTQFYSKQDIEEIKSSQQTSLIVPVFPVKSTIQIRINEIQSAINANQRDITFPDPQLTQRESTTQRDGGFFTKRESVISQSESPQQLQKSTRSVTRGKGSSSHFRSNEFQNSLNLDKLNLILGESSMAQRKSTSINEGQVIIKDRPVAQEVKGTFGVQKQFMPRSLDNYTKRQKNGLYDQILDHQNDVTEYLIPVINKNEDILRKIELFSQCQREKFAPLMDQYMKLCLSREVNDPFYDYDFYSLNLQIQWIQLAYQIIEFRLRMMGFREEKINVFQEKFEFYQIKFFLSKQMIEIIGGIQDVRVLVEKIVKEMVSKFHQFKPILSHYDEAIQAFGAVMNSDQSILIDQNNSLQTILVNPIEQEHFFHFKILIWQNLDPQISFEDRMLIMQKVEWTRDIINGDFNQYFRLIKPKLAIQIYQSLTVGNFLQSKSMDMINELMEQIRVTFYTFGGTFENLVDFLNENSQIELTDKFFNEIEMKFLLKTQKQPEIFREDFVYKLRQLQSQMNIGLRYDTIFGSDIEPVLQSIKEWVESQMVFGFISSKNKQKVLNMDFLRFFLSLFLSSNQAYNLLDTQFAIEFYQINIDTVRLWFNAIQHCMQSIPTLQGTQVNEFLIHINRGLLIHV